MIGLKGFRVKEVTYKIIKKGKKWLEGKDLNREDKDWEVNIKINNVSKDWKIGETHNFSATFITKPSLRKIFVYPLTYDEAQKKRRDKLVEMMEGKEKKKMMKKQITG